MLVTAKRHLLGCVELSPRASVECYLELTGEDACVLLRQTLDLTIRDLSFSFFLCGEQLEEAIQGLAELQSLNVAPDMKIAADRRVPCDVYSRYDFIDSFAVDYGVSFVYAWRTQEPLNHSGKPHYYVCFTVDEFGEPAYHFSLVRKEKLRDLQSLLESAWANLPHIAG